MVDGATDVSCLELELYVQGSKWQHYSHKKKAWKKKTV